jgi:hypothetical protein
VSGIFNRGIFEWTVHEDETVKHEVPEEMRADCSLRSHKLFPIRALIERHRRSHLNLKGGAAGNCDPLGPRGGPIAIKGRYAMKNFASANKYLSAAFALVAIAAAGTVPAFAQSRDHTGSMMPFYYDATGAQSTGSWAPEGTAAQPQRPLYLYAGKHSPRHGVRAH